jgi:alpha,alpha-trehalase
MERRSRDWIPSFQTVLPDSINTVWNGVLEHLDSGSWTRAEPLFSEVGLMTDLAEQARQVLRDNDRGGFTIPTNRLYPFQWLWDAGFTALGWITFDEPRAWQELEMLFLGQWDDGMLPHIVFHRPEPTYFPGPEVWGTRQEPRTSGITQPPVIATHVRMMLEVAKDQGLAETSAKALYPKILEFHRWLYRARDPNNTGLVAILHPWEAGTDNSPTWDAALARVPVAPSLPAYQRRDTNHVDASQRPHQHEYDRYLSLVMRFREANYDPQAAWQSATFRIADVCFNAVLHKANRDLLALAQRFGEAVQEIEGWLERGTVGLESLWDEDAGHYFAWDQLAKASVKIPTSSGFLPLYAGTSNPECAARLIVTLERWGQQVRYLVPSTDPTHPKFESRRYWRGPTWAFMNMMIAEGLRAYDRNDLSERLRRDTLELMECSGFAEYWDPNTAEALGGGHFSWTAATYLSWVQNKS